MILSTSLLLAHVALATPVRFTPGGRPVARPPRVRPAPPRRIMPPSRARSHHPDELQAAQLLADAISDLGCDRAGEALRRLSNAILANGKLASDTEIAPPAPGDMRSRARHEMQKKWKAHMSSPLFWKTVWETLAESFRSCDLTCFDDGDAIGRISGTMYCSASLAVGGLDLPGLRLQQSLPLCGNATFVACQSGYRKAAAGVAGCGAYTQSGFEDVFLQSISQDCHLEETFQ